MKTIGLSLDHTVKHINQDYEDDVITLVVNDDLEVYENCTKVFQREDETTVQISDEEMYAAAKKAKWDEIRLIRNNVLSESDWTQLPDITLTDEAKAAWLEYRQALRDLIDETGNPFAVTWPEKP